MRKHRDKTSLLFCLTFALATCVVTQMGSLSFAQSNIDPNNVGGAANADPLKRRAPDRSFARKPGDDDAKWVAQCVSDNQNGAVTVEVITKYCTCMNNQMSDSETQSITQWEKVHAAERQACDKESGWR